MGALRVPQALAQQIEGVEQQEVGAKQHQLVGQVEVRDMGGVPGLEPLDQLVLADPGRRAAQQLMQLLGEVEGGVEFAIHHLSLTRAAEASLCA
ncbi:hypothetical protein D3C85_1713320 [compost metagenome]